MDVILHIGAHRTATTTLQRVLGQNQARLRANGVTYWGPKRTRGGLFSGLLGDAGPILPWQADQIVRATGLVRMETMQLEQAGYRALIVSEENILGTVRENLWRGALYPEAAARLDRFRAPFAGLAGTIAIGLRCYDAYWASAMAFALAKGGPAPDAEVTARLIDQPRRWRDLITEAARAFPDARILVWSYEGLGARPEAQLRAMIGAIPDLSGLRDWHNAAPTPGFLRAVLADRGEPAALIAEAAGRFMPFDTGQRMALRAQYAEDLDWLRNGAGGLATFIDDPATNGAATGQGRGRPNDGDDRRLA